jgi:hypothetical protein
MKKMIPVLFLSLALNLNIVSCTSKDTSFPPPAATNVPPQELAQKFLEKFSTEFQKH